MDSSSEKRTIKEEEDEVRAEMSWTPETQLMEIEMAEYLKEERTALL